MRNIPFTNSAKPKATKVLINFIRLEIYWIHQLPRWHAKICCKQFGRRYPQLAFSSKLGIHIIAKHHFYALNTSNCQEKQIRKTWLVWHFWMTQSKCPSNFMHFFAEMLTQKLLQNWFFFSTFRSFRRFPFDRHGILELWLVESPSTVLFSVSIAAFPGRAALAPQLQAQGCRLRFQVLFDLWVVYL